CLLSLAKKYGIAKRMSGDALHTLGSYHWPGNVRQLISVVTMGYAMAEGTYIEPDDFVAEFNKRAGTKPITRKAARLKSPGENTPGVVGETKNAGRTGADHPQGRAAGARAEKQPAGKQPARKQHRAARGIV